MTTEEILQAMIDQHPDVAKGVGDAEAQNWLAANWPWLTGFIEYNKLDGVKVVTAAICFTYEWGVQFEKLNGHPPADDDWKNAYYNNSNAFADKLGMLKPFSGPDNRLRIEYGGPY